jgi:hypothetical protein
MIHSFRTARDVYLCHTLSAANELLVKLSDQDDGSHALRRCILACKTVLRYIRGAQSACGVLGLVAIDRSEENLLICLRDLRAGDASGSHGIAPCSAAGLCYANAINRQCRGDHQLQELWTFAATRLDTVTRLLHTYFSAGDAKYSVANEIMPLTEREVLLAKAVSFDSKQKAAQQEGKVWNSKFLGRAAHFCRLALVCAQICSLHDAGSRLFPGTTKAMSLQMKHQCLAVQVVVTMIERNLFVCDIADPLHTTEVQLLAERAALILEEALDLTVSSDGAGDLAEKQRKADILVSNATALASLVCVLSAVTTQLEELRASTTSARYTELLVGGAAGRLQSITAEIAGSASDGGSDAVHVRDHARLAAAIAKVAHDLQDAKETLCSWDERTVQRFLTEADKVNREASRAHPHITACWALAAKHMNLALEARASASTEAHVKHAADLKSSARWCENLASGALSDAALCFAKAKCSVSGCAREFWESAAGALCLMGETRLGRLRQAAYNRAAAITMTKLTCENEVEAGQLTYAAACADCAHFLEVTMPDANELMLALTQQGRIVALSTSYVDVGLQVRLLLVQVEHTFVMRAHNRQDVEGLTDVAHHLRILVNDTLLLSQTLQEPPQVYPKDHLLYEPTLSAEATQQRDQLLHWLSYIAVECCELYKQVVEELRLRSPLTMRLHKATACTLAALHLAESVRWYLLDGSGPPNAYTIESPGQVRVYQVLCDRYFAAASLVFTWESLPHALLVQAAERHLDINLALPHALAVNISNALVCRAWRLTSAEPVPAKLLLLAPEHNTEHDAVRLQDNIEAYVLQAIHHVALIEGSYRAKEGSLRKRAVAYYAHVIVCYKILIQTSIPDNQGRIADSCLRARQAAGWCHLAIEALHSGRSDVATLYERAVELVVVETDVTRLDRMSAADVQAGQVGVIAAKWFVAAAAALIEENLPQHHLRLLTAEATAALVVFTRDGDNVKLALTGSYSATALQGADQLAAQQPGSRQPSLPAQCCVLN